MKKHQIVIPEGAVSMSEVDERMVEGGLSFHKNWVSYSIDLGLLAFGIWGGGTKFASWLASKGFAKVSQIVTKVVGGFSSFLKTKVGIALNAVNGILGIVASFSIGNAIGYAMDRFDSTKKADSYITW